MLHSCWNVDSKLTKCCIDNESNSARGLVTCFELGIISGAVYPRLYYCCWECLLRLRGILWCTPKNLDFWIVRQVIQKMKCRFRCWYILVWSKHVCRNISMICTGILVAATSRARFVRYRNYLRMMLDSKKIIRQLSITMYVIVLLSTTRCTEWKK